MEQFFDIKDGVLTEYKGDKTNVSRIVIPAEVTQIGKKAFWGCDQLKYVDFSECTGLKTIGYRAFYNCQKLQGMSKETKMLPLPKTVTTIEDEAFCGCTSLGGICLPEGLETIGKGAFTDCKKLGSVSEGRFHIPKTATSIGSYAFINCESITSVDHFPKRHCIKEGTFFGCKKLTTKEFYNIVKTAPKIERYAFQHCANISGEIRLPKCVREIEEGAFWNCPQIKSFQYHEQVKAELHSTVFYSTRFPSTRRKNVTYGVTHLDEYDCDHMKGGIPSTVTHIGFGTFKYAALTHITIPASVEQIGEQAFCDCLSLEKIKFENPASIKTIDDGAFWGCYNLTHITLPASVEDIGTNAFWGCSHLTIKVPAGAKIGKDAFEGCLKVIGYDGAR